MCRSGISRMCKRPTRRTGGVGWGGCGDRLRSDHVADGNENADDDDDDDK